jgi:hypothetical protein
MRIISFAVLLVVVAFVPATAFAKPHTLSWIWATTDCDGGALAQTDYYEAEIAISQTSMPMPSDNNDGCTVTDPDAPAEATVIPVPITDNQITLNLQPGATYYARIRASSFVAGNWSSWSTEVVFTVPYGKPNKTKLNGD